MLHKYLYFLLLLTFTQSVEASQFRLLVGPRVETASETSSSISNTNPFNLILEYDMRVHSRYYFSVGASGEFDLATTSSKGFGLFGSVRYYLKGDPSLIESSGKDIKFNFVEPISYFVGLGFFHKNINFEDGAKIRRIEGDVGGLIFSGGGNYSISKRYYIAGLLQFLLGGSGSKTEYTSIEAYVGLGLRF